MTWKTTTWGDSCELRYGKALKNYKHFNSDYPVYGSGGIVGSVDKTIAPKNSVIVSRKGTLTAYWSPKPSHIIDTAFWLQPSEKLDSRWAYYAIKNLDVSTLVSGSGVPSLSRDDFYREELLLPSLLEQRAIARVLGCLDDKIELNQKMNETLEEMARAIFQSWFIDFDPVRAKMEGRPTGLPDDISNLFPDALVDSEIGKIPKGWSVFRVKEQAIRQKVGKFYSNKTVSKTGEIPVIDQSDDGVIGFHSNKECVFASLENPVFTFANHTCKMRLLFENFGVIQNVIPIRSDNYPTIWFFLRTLGIKKLEEYKGHIPEFMETKLCFPDVPLASAFEEQIRPIFHRIHFAKKENQTLAELRDTLLPKLMSGELRIKDAEREVEDVS